MYKSLSNTYYVSKVITLITNLYYSQVLHINRQLLISIIFFLIISLVYHYYFYYYSTLLFTDLTIIFVILQYFKILNKGPSNYGLHPKYTYYKKT